MQRPRSIELLLLVAALGCQQTPRTDKTMRTRGPASAVVPVSLAPRPASSFDCGAEGCIQLHPRLPDSGEWRCAERGQVVWCAGGEPAAGVVSGPADARYRCGRRWSNAGAERVCIDRSPDYPNQQPLDYSCRFQQERGIRRQCLLAQAEPGKPLPELAVPACWLDRDCRAQRCDRGTCGCNADADCEVGRCQQGSCVEVKR
jgi:hypothetical protein